MNNERLGRLALQRGNHSKAQGNALLMPATLATHRFMISVIAFHGVQIYTVTAAHSANRQATEARPAPPHRAPGAHRGMNMKFALTKTATAGVIALAALAVVGSTAQAQITSIPPLLQGQASKHIWSIAGVVTASGLATVVTCTNVNTAAPAVLIGVQVFDATGAAVNDPSSTSLSVGPGATVFLSPSQLSDLWLTATSLSALFQRALHGYWRLPEPVSFATLS
jgi:hypothetical protein